MPARSETCQVFLWGERGFSSATNNVPSPLAPPARGEGRPRLAGVGEGALAAELNAALRSGPRRFEVQDFARIGDTWKQGVRFRIAEVSPYEKSGPSWVGTRPWLVVRRCALACNLAKLAHAAVRRRHSRTPVSRAPSPTSASPRVPESAPSHRLSNVPRRLMLGQRFASRDSEHTLRPAGWGEAHNREASGAAAARSASSRLCLE